MKTAIMLVLAATALASHSRAGGGAGQQVQRDIAYAEPKNPRQMLDVYAAAEGKNRPVVFWIHGGG